jgi:primosomal protein N'
MFAEVAVPVYIRQTFTYRLLGDMAARAQVGCRVVVSCARRTTRLKSVLEIPASNCLSHYVLLAKQTRFLRLVRA